MESVGKKDISVDRLTRAGSDAAIGIADAVAAARGATFYGWATIAASQAAGNGRRIVATPRIDNRYHADIVLPSSAIENRDEQKRHAKALADRAVWRERSDQWPASG